MQAMVGPVARAFYKNALGAFLMYEVGNAASFEAVSRWKTEIDDMVSATLLSFSCIFRNHAVFCLFWSNTSGDGQPRETSRGKGCKTDHSTLKDLV